MEQRFEGKRVISLAEPEIYAAAASESNKVPLARSSLGLLPGGRSKRGHSGLKTAMSVAILAWGILVLLGWSNAKVGPSEILDIELSGNLTLPDGTPYDGEASLILSQGSDASFLEVGPFQVDVFGGVFFFQLSESPTSIGFDAIKPLRFEMQGGASSSLAYRDTEIFLGADAGAKADARFVMADNMEGGVARLFLPDLVLAPAPYFGSVEVPGNGESVSLQIAAGDHLAHPRVIGDFAVRSKQVIMTGSQLPLYSWSSSTHFTVWTAAGSTGPGQAQLFRRGAIAHYTPVQLGQFSVTFDLAHFSSNSSACAYPVTSYSAFVPTDSSDQKRTNSEVRSRVQSSPYRPSLPYFDAKGVFDFLDLPLGVCRA